MDISYNFGEHDYFTKNGIVKRQENHLITQHELLEIDITDYVNRKPIKLSNNDSTARGRGRETQQGNEVSKKAYLIDCFFILISVFTYIADIATDAVIAMQMYDKSEWVWFGLIVFFIVEPSIILQLLSCKWHYDDYGRQHWFSICLHILQSGPLERYCKAFWYGLRTICGSRGAENNAARKKNYEAYLSNWRDMCMLRFLESFLEGAPQLIIQFYIISQISRERLLANWLHIASVGISMVALGWSIVTYTYVLRLSEMKTSYSVCGYIFQIFYRVLMVTSRITAIVVFITKYKWLVIIFLCIHWIVMIYFLSAVSAQFCVNADGNTQYCFEHLFTCIMGFVYIFCFINTKDGATRVRVTLYYTLFFVENSLMVAVWVFVRENFGLIEYAVMSLVWGGFLLGLISMILYYRFFHPDENVTGGWFHCRCCRKDFNVLAAERRMTFRRAASREIYRRLQSNLITEKVYVDIEFPTRKRLRSFTDNSVALERNVKVSSQSHGRICDGNNKFICGEPSNQSCSSKSEHRQNFKENAEQCDMKDFDYSGLITSFI